jgi:hypothetical protein
MVGQCRCGGDDERKRHGGGEEGIFISHFAPCFIFCCSCSWSSAKALRLEHKPWWLSPWRRTRLDQGCPESPSSKFQTLRDFVLSDYSASTNAAMPPHAPDAEDYLPCHWLSQILGRTIGRLSSSPIGPRHRWNSFPRCSPSTHSIWSGGV